MKRAAWLALIFLFLGASHVSGQTQTVPSLSQERAVLRTSLGDIVLAFYKDAAPKHTAKFKELSRRGLYDGSLFYLVYPGYVAQVYGIRHGGRSLNASDLEAARPLPVEKSALKNIRGSVSMAQDLKSPNSDESSFSIFLAPSTTLDGRNTVFARVVRGLDVAEAISRVNAGPKREPYDPVILESVRVVPDESSLAALNLRGVIARTEKMPRQFPVEWIVMVAAMMLCGLTAFLTAGRLATKVAASMGLLTVLIGFFLLYTALVPNASHSNFMGTVLLLSALAVFKLMTFFEK